MRDTIIINATNLGRFIDGIGVYVLNLVQELVRLDSNCFFVVYVNRTAAPHLNDIILPEHFELRWVSSIVSPDHGFKGHFLRLLFSQYLGLKHRRSPIFAASQLEAILLRKNQFITIHDIIPLLFRTLHKKQYYYYRYLLSRVLRRSRAVITPSQHTKKMLIEHYGLERSKIHVIHNGVRSILAGVKCERSEVPYIVFCGRLVPMKNLHGVVSAFNAIKDRVPHKLLIIGRLRHKKMLKLFRGVDLERVEFQGHVSATEMECVLQNASLLVFPSFHEGFGFPPLESMAHGCPALVSNVSSLPEICGDAAEYVDPNDIESIAAGMYRLLTDEYLRKRLIANGYSRVERFQWRTAAIRHLGILVGMQGFSR